MHRIFAAAVALLLLPFAAHAAEVAGTTVDFTPLVRDVLLPIVGAALSVLATWAIGRGLKLIGLENDRRIRDFLTGLAERGIAYGKSKVGGVPLSFEVKNDIVRYGAEYLTKQGPGALKHFGLDDEAIRRFLEAKLHLEENPPPVPATAVVPLPPAGGTAPTGGAT